MSRHKALRDVLGAFLVGVATAAGLLTSTPAPHSLILVIAAFGALVALLVDVVVFDRPVELRTSPGKVVVGGLGALAIASGLVAAFLIGHELQTTASRYAFLVTNKDGPITPAKAVPAVGTDTNNVFETGQAVWVTCYVNLKDGRWYKLANQGGWLRDAEVLAAPYTGEGSPPPCAS